MILKGVEKVVRTLYPLFDIVADQIGLLKPGVLSAVTKTDCLLWSFLPAQAVPSYVLFFLPSAESYQTIQVGLKRLPLNALRRSTTTV